MFYVHDFCEKKQINCTTPFFLGARRAPRPKTWVHSEKVWVHRAPVHPLISNTELGVVLVLFYYD